MFFSTRFSGACRAKSSVNNYTHDQFEYGPARVALFRRHAAAVVARRSAGGGGRSRAVTGAASHHRSAANTSFAGPPALVRRGTDDTAPRRFPGPGPPFAAFRGAAACDPVGSTAPAYYAAALVPCVRRCALPRGGRAASNSVNISRIRPFPPPKDNFTDVETYNGSSQRRGGSQGEGTMGDPTLEYSVLLFEKVWVGHGK